ncbi:MAG: pseudouridine synthase [Cyanobacteria bacterium J06641_5]
MKERIQKLLSQWGVASRRRAEAMILAGRVRLNGEVATLGDKADPERDRLEVDGRALKPTNRPQFLYLLVNKPLGTISTCSDPEGRPTVLQLLPPLMRKGKGLHPVGRLDADSSGALLLTNDGDLTLRLTHPRYDPAKTYRVWVNGDVSAATVERWRRGVWLDGRKTRPAKVQILKPLVERTLLEIVLNEGRNRQIRRVAEQLGHSVRALHRSAIGPVRLNPTDGKPLEKGEFRYLSAVEVSALKQELPRAKTATKTIPETP